MRQAVFVLFVLLFAGSLHADSRKQDVRPSAAQKIFDRAKSGGDHASWSKALGLIEKHLKKRPNDPVAVHARGWLLLQTSTPAAAVVELDRAIELAPDNAGALVDSGTAYSTLVQPTIAAERFERALVLAPDSFDANHGAAVELYWNRAYGKSLARFEKAASLAPKRFEPHAGIVQSYRSLGKHADAETAHATLLAIWKRSVGDDSGFLVERFSIRRSDVEVFEYPKSGILSFIIRKAHPHDVIVSIVAKADGAGFVFHLVKNRSKTVIPTVWKVLPPYPDLKAELVKLIELHVPGG